MSPEHIHVTPYDVFIAKLLAVSVVVALVLVVWIIWPEPCPQGRTNTTSEQACHTPR